MSNMEVKVIFHKGSGPKSLSPCTCRVRNMCWTALYWLSAQHLNWTHSSFWINISLGGEGIAFLTPNTVFLLWNSERNVYLWNIRNWNPFCLLPGRRALPAPWTRQPWPPARPRGEGCTQNPVPGVCFLSKADFQRELHEGNSEG